MRTWIVAATLLIALSAVGDETFTVRGVVTAGAEALPGCTVTLRGEAVRQVVSNVDGRYAFRNVPAGDYTLEFDLTGFKSESRELRVNGDVDVQQQEIEIGELGPITLACGGPSCNDTRPENESAYDWPLCSDYRLDEMLIEGTKGGDPSAIEYLQKRYASTLSYEHKHRIAAALLGRASDDRAYWNELASHANDAIRFAYVNDKPTPEFEQWCADRKIEVEQQHDMLSFAFQMAAEDARSKPLVLRALESSDRWLVLDAIVALQAQHDASRLPEIGKAIARFPDDIGMLASYLVYFQSEAADELALSLLDDEGKAEYLRQRDEYAASIVEYESNR